MSCNVLSFPDGAPVETEIVDVHDEFDDLVETDSAHPLVSAEQKALLLEKIDRLRHLVEQGRCESLVFAGQDPLTGYFIQEICIEPDLNRSELFGFMGILESLKIEISEGAAMAPVVTLTGSVLDPFVELSE